MRANDAVSLRLCTAFDGVGCVPKLEAGRWQAESRRPCLPISTLSAITNRVET